MERNSGYGKKNTGRNRKGIRKFLLGNILGIVCLVAVIAVFAWKVPADASEQETRYKYFTSVYIQRDDTLWDISSQYITDEYDDIHDYMQEVMVINHLTDDHLQYGKRITVPYYSSELK